MSAIWGMVDFGKVQNAEETAIKMEEPYHTYKIEKYQKYVLEGVIFGYGSQYFTKESRFEKQPIVENDRSFFAADAVLDNREELLELLDVPKEEQSIIADGTLMYRIFKKFGRQGIPMMLGTYAFAYYDADKEEVILTVDSVGSRCLYYTYESGKIFFSTLIKPILKAKQKETQWNYRFFTDYLALNNLSPYTEAEETPYFNLYKVAPAQTVIINKQGLHKEDYWTVPIKEKRLKKSDTEFKNDIINLFDRSVQSVMRSSQKTGILLSGGLDSTSVACFAAPKLKARGELLYSYTSVPEKDYISKEPPFYYTSEKQMVDITKEFLGNLSTTFLELPGINGFDGAKEFMESYELPHKLLQNVRWFHEAAAKAAKDGCRILLTGQFGNSTISFGDFRIYFYSLMKAGRFKTLFNEVNMFERNNHYGRKRIYKELLEQLTRNRLMNHGDQEDLFSSVYANPVLMKKFGIKRRFDHINSIKGRGLKTVRETIPDLYNKVVLAHMGEFETHLSLVTGVLLRDPTRDRRLVEYCVRLPENQFVHYGTDRRLVKEYFKNYLPREILLENHKGLQSADLLNRMNKNWGNIHQRCNDLLEHHMAEILLDIPKIRAKLSLYHDGPMHGDRFDLTKVLYSFLVIEYISTFDAYLLQNC